MANLLNFLGLHILFQGPLAKWVGHPLGSRYVDSFTWVHIQGRSWDIRLYLHSFPVDIFLRSSTSACKLDPHVPDLSRKFFQLGSTTTTTTITTTTTNANANANTTTTTSTVQLPTCMGICILLKLEAASVSGQKWCQKRGTYTI